jgi:hypothetical protein
VTELSPISRAINEIETQMKYLRENITELDRVLSGILLPDEQVKACSSEATPCPPRAPLECWLHEHLSGIFMCNEKLVSYKNRCQL